MKYLFEIYVIVDELQSNSARVSNSRPLGYKPTTEI